MAKSKLSPQFQRLLSASRKKSTHLARRPWRTRKKQQVIKLTPVEKAARKARRRQEKVTHQEALQNAQEEVRKLGEQLRSKFGKHTIQYYIEEIMQISRLQKKQRRAGAWNAFVSKEVKRLNDGRYFFYLICEVAYS